MLRNSIVRWNTAVYWNTALAYCKNLDEGGHSDWRLPNIDELRSLVQNHPGTISGGKCKISEEHNKLDKKYATNDCEGRKGNNFSKFGDRGELWSSSKFVNSEEPNGWVINFDNGAMITTNYDIYDKADVRCVRQDERDACETAKKYNKPDYWFFYFSNFPNSECDAKAKSAWIKEDKNACKTAKKANTRAAWEKYLKKFPKGKCADEAKNKIKEMETKKVEPEITWSSKSKKVMSWKQANQYCENLKEGGSSNWRLPTISELRTLVMKCDSTEAGGACGVTDQCLSVGECKNKACGGCGRKVQHNKLGDKGFFWSSSISPDNKHAWYIDFTYGSIHNHSNSDKFVRCVR